MAKDIINYPLPGFHFSVSFGKLLPPGSADLRFQEVSGLSAELVTEEFAVGGENGFVYKIPLRTKFPNLVLKRALTPASSKLTKWAEDAIYHFDIKPAQVQVILLNDMHLPVSAWVFKNAYPVKMAVSDFNAMTNGIVIESFELAYQNSYKVSLSSI
jgi:phage tail-like protein